MKIQKRYRYRIYPDEKQRVFLEKTFGGCRFTYNHILNEIKSQYAKYKEDSTGTKPNTSSIALGYRIKPLRRVWWTSPRETKSKRPIVGMSVMWTQPWSRY